MNLKTSHITFAIAAAHKKRLDEFEKYPKYKQLYINAFDKMLEAHPNKESHYTWENGIDVFNWWLGNN